MTKTIVLSPLLLCLLSTIATAKSDSDILEPIKSAKHCLLGLKIHSENPTQAPNDWGKGCLETAQECSAAINRRVLAGQNENTTHVLIDGYQDVTLAQVRSEYCDKLASMAQDFDEKVRAAKEEREVSLAAPFKAARMKGDKLELAILARRGGDKILGVGGVLLTPAQIKRAKLLFITQQDRDGYWTVYRFVFKGDKEVRRTKETYIIRPGSSKFR